MGKVPPKRYAIMMAMIRKQIQLTQHQARALRREASRRAVSEAALVREAVEAWVKRGRLATDREDFVSFEMMRSEGLDRAFAFDDDFEKAGFATLP